MANLPGYPPPSAGSGEVVSNVLVITDTCNLNVLELINNWTNQRSDIQRITRKEPDSNYSDMSRPRGYKTCVGAVKPVIGLQ